MGGLILQGGWLGLRSLVLARIVRLGLGRGRFRVVVLLVLLGQGLVPHLDQDLMQSADGVSASQEIHR